AYSDPVAPRWPPATSWALAPGIRNGTNSNGMTIITSMGAASRRRILASSAATDRLRRSMHTLRTRRSLPVLQDAQIGLLERGTLHVDLDYVGGQVPELLQTCCQGAARREVCAGGDQPWAGAFPGRRYWHRPVLADPGIQPDPYPRATPGIDRVLHCTMVLDPAIGEHGETGAEELQLVHIVRGVDHRGAGIGQVADVAHDLVAGLDVRPDGAHVQEPHGRPVHRRRGSAQAPAPATAEMLGTGAGARREAERLDHRLPSGSGASPYQTVYPSHPDHVLAHGQHRVHAELLRGCAQMPGCRPAVGGHIDPVDAYLATVGCQRSGGDRDEGGFTGAVRTEQAHHLAGLDAQARTAEHLMGTERLVDPGRDQSP